jgi:hypothetical protein
MVLFRQRKLMNKGIRQAQVRKIENRLGKKKSSPCGLDPFAITVIIKLPIVVSSIPHRKWEESV